MFQRIDMVYGSALSFVLLAMIPCCNTMLFKTSHAVSGSQLGSVHGISWDLCLAECQRRSTCKSATYERTIQNCHLYSQVTSSFVTVSSPGLIYGEPSWRITQESDNTCLVNTPCEEGFRCDINGTCTKAECDSPPTMPSAETQGNVWQVGGRVKYKCITSNSNIDTSKIPSVATICQANGEWSSANLICDCGSPTEIANTKADGSETIFGSVVTYSCAEGYKSNGGSTVSTCLGNEGWSVPTLNCSLIDCGYVPVVNNAAVVATGTLFGDNVTYTCNSEYVSNYGTNVAVCASTGKWTAVSITCSKINCGSPGMITHATEVFGSTLFGGTVTYACNDGYKSSTDITEAVSTCQQNGAWSEVNFSCEEEQSNIKNFSLYMTDALATQSPIIITTYGEAEQCCFTLEECAQKCMNEINYCIAISYLASNQTCILVDRLFGGIITAATGWFIMYKHIGITYSYGPDGWYTLTNSAAVNYCTSTGSTIASDQDIQNAYDLGFNLNQCGWIEGNKAVIVLHYPDPGFYTQTGINTCTWGNKYGVFCKAGVETGTPSNA